MRQTPWSTCSPDLTSVGICHLPRWPPLLCLGEADPTSWALQTSRSPGQCPPHLCRSCPAHHAWRTTTHIVLSSAIHPLPLQMRLSVAERRHQCSCLFLLELVSFGGHFLDKKASALKQKLACNQTKIASFLPRKALIIKAGV